MENKEKIKENNKENQNGKFEKMKEKFFDFFKFKKTNNTAVTFEEANHAIDPSLPKSKLKVVWNFIRMPLTVTACLGVLCGIIYPITITGFAQTAFPYEANGSQIKVKVNGEWKVYGSKLIGEDFYTDNDGRYMFGRLNFAGEDLNINQDDVSKKINGLITQYNIADKFNKNSKNQIEIPNQLITESGSGVDPTISLEASKWQIPLIIAARKKINPNDQVNEQQIIDYINKYSSSAFAGIFGNSGTNVLLVNLALDGIVVEG